MLSYAEVQVQREKAEQEDPEAQCKLGKYYLEKHDSYEAKKWFERAAPKSLEAQFELAKISYSQDYDMSESMEKIFVLAKQYEPACDFLKEGGEGYKKLRESRKYQAFYFLGKIYSSDSFKLKNIEKATECYKKVIEENRDHNKAKVELAKLYYEEGEKRAYKEAFKLLEEVDKNFYYSLKPEFAEAWYFLGKMYEQGQGVTKNPDKAIEYYEKLTSIKEYNVSQVLGGLYFNKCQEAEGYYKPTYREKAIRYLSQSPADKNNQNYLGIMHYENKNYSEAAKWFQQAANQGLAVAFLNLASTYDDNKCGADKTKLAGENVKKAAELSNASAQYKLSGFYKDGQQGFEKNELQAFHWLRKAAVNGYEQAKKDLKNEASSLYRYQKSCQLLESKLDYTFDDPIHLLTAINRIHNPKRKEAEYQRYEFLGDKFLNAVIAQYIEENTSKDRSTGELEKIYQAMINNSSVLPEVAKRIGLNELLILDPTEKANPITDKVLADAFEAIIGAVIKDSDFAQAEEMVLKFWKPYLQVKMVELEAVIEKEKQKPIASASSSSQSISSQQAKNMPTPVAETSSIPSVSNRLLTPRTQRLFTSLGGKVSVAEFEKAVKVAPDVNRCNVGKKGDTPLMHLLRNNKLGEGNELPKIEILLKYGALWDKGNKRNETARALLIENHPKFRSKFKI